MNAAKRHDECARFSCSLGTYVDGELDPSHTVETEAHVVGCVACSERVTLLRAVRTSLKRGCQQPAPEAMRQKMAALLAAEAKKVLMGEPIAARTWARKSGDSTCAASSRRLASDHAGETLR